MALSNLPAGLVVGAVVIWLLYPSDEFGELKRLSDEKGPLLENDESAESDNSTTTWDALLSNLGFLSGASNYQWSSIPDKVRDLIMPEWAVGLPEYVRKLQAELSMAPGSLADEIWAEAHDPFVNSEIRYSAKVRVSTDLCDEEKEFLSRRRLIARVALAKYLGLRERDVHPEDVPVIAMCGSGGGLRALVAGTGSLLATEEDGLLDCVTYTAGVSGSCWLQAIFHSSIAKGRLQRVLDHVKARCGIHIAYPPAFFDALVTAPTNKFLLSGMVEKLKGDPKADFGLVDVYGLLISARYLVPKGELGVDATDLKLSNQRDNVKFGQSPLPIYTAVRHEIPDLNVNAPKGTSASEPAKEMAKQEAWFQWFEITPYEFFCEEFSAGIPTWAMGRHFNDGVDVPPETGFHLPEIRMPLLMGIFGSAFCATLSHYYREVRPLVQSISGLGGIDDLIYQRNEDLSKVHPIDPATVPNFAYAMDGKLPKTVPPTIYKSKYIQLMDAGMSNNLPIYPLLRPGRNVEVLIAFDASADIATDNWLSVADGYALQRGIKGWPVGIGWPQKGKSPAKTEEELRVAQASSTGEADAKLEAAQDEQAARKAASSSSDPSSSNKQQPAGPSSPKKDPANEKEKFEPGDESKGELGYCTVWVGTTEERAATPPPPSKAISDETAWQLAAPGAGLAVIYLPFLANDKVPAVHPGTSDFLSTWNFVYTPQQVDDVVALARANYAEGRRQIRDTIRAVYERKKRMREEAEERERKERYRRLVRRGMAHRLGEGDQFS